MPVQLNLKKVQLEDLATIRDLDDSILEQIIEKINSAPQVPLHPNQINQLINNILKDPIKTSSVVRNLASSYALIGQRDMSPKDIVEAITNGIKAESRTPWSEKELRRWEAKFSVLIKLYSLVNIKLLIKALELSYDYDNLFQNSKILTDIRPVYDDLAENIRGAIISHTLHIYYDNSIGSNSIQISLDEKDIKQLYDNCDRALKKSQVAKSLWSKTGIESFICGTEDDEI